MPIPERVQYFDFLTTASSFLTRSVGVLFLSSPRPNRTKCHSSSSDSLIASNRTTGYPSLTGRDLKEVIWFPDIASMRYWAYPVLSIQRTDG